MNSKKAKRLRKDAIIIANPNLQLPTDYIEVRRIYKTLKQMEKK